MKKFNEVYLDFEFNEVTHQYVNLVCCVTYDPRSGDIKKWWLHRNSKNKTALGDYLRKFKKIIGYACVAEGRSLISLNLDPMNFKWEDLFTEYKMLTNHNDRFQWGKQLVNGKVKTVRKPKPKWERTEEESASGFKATHSLLEATYKLTGEIRNSSHKEAMRELIISNPRKFNKKQKRAILKYCADDVVHLPKIRESIIKGMEESSSRRFDLEAYIKGAEERGIYSALTAWRESRGYPINVEATRNFSRQIPTIMYRTQKEINNLFPEIKPFKWNKREQRYTWDQKITKKWIAENHDTSRWMKTDKGGVSLSLEAFQRFYDYKHDYPEDVFGAQIVRFLKLKQSLYGFSASNLSSSRKNFWDSVGPDGMVRAYLNPFAAQSSRSQPAASGFIFLKPAWMRSLVQPPKGYFMAGIDYSSQEFFISALEAEDKNMIQAYISGDPYFYFAKLAGAVPKDSERDKNNKKLEAVRDLFKSTCVAEGTLIRVKDKGYLPIEKVCKEDLVWDGEEWRSHDGPTYMGEKEVFHTEGHSLVTADHKILSVAGEWYDYEIYQKSKIHKWKVLKKDREGLRRARASWSDVRSLASLIFKTSFNKIWAKIFSR